ncbi:MAG TPA: hypothetical protein VMU81_13140 [Acetobacteraceae bacterium]|jgi:hypothetical protein|nr:hypothetical protein [Acetobacteraceae bacterium]
MSGQSGRSTTLEFLAQQQAKIINELADQRADMAVLLAIVQRLDGSTQGLVGEDRALHGQIGRFGHRLRRLETAAGET